MRFFKKKLNYIIIQNIKDRYAIGTTAVREKQKMDSFLYPNSRLTIETPPSSRPSV